MTSRRVSISKVQRRLERECTMRVSPDATGEHFYQLLDGSIVDAEGRTIPVTHPVFETFIPNTSPYLPGTNAQADAMLKALGNPENRIPGTLRPGKT